MCNWWIVLICCTVVFIASLVAYFIINENTYSDPVWFVLISVVTGIGLIILGVIIPVQEICTKKNFYKWQLKREYVMEVIDTMDSYDYANFGITSTILEYNEWLEDAKARKATYGNWSFYRNLPVEELEYIGLIQKEGNNNDQG